MHIDLNGLTVSKERRYNNKGSNFDKRKIDGGKNIAQGSSILNFGKWQQTKQSRDV